MSYPQRLYLPETFMFGLMYYISGPMSNMPDHNFPYFHLVADVCRKTGLTVTSPAEVPINHPAPWADCLKADIVEMMKCDGIILLKGWPQSRGARMELEIALSLEFPTYYLHGWTLLDMNRPGSFV